MDSPGVVTDMNAEESIAWHKAGGPGHPKPVKRMLVVGCAKLIISPIGPGTAKVCKLAMGEKLKPDDRPQPPVPSLTWLQKPVFRPCLARRRLTKDSCASNSPKSRMLAASDRHSRRCRAACL